VSVRAEVAFELTMDPEVEAAGWLRIPRGALDGDAFPRARLGDLLCREPGIAGRIRALGHALARLGAVVLRRRGVAWPSRT